MQEINPVFIDICVFIAFLSVLGSVLVIYSHIKVPQLNKHPGQMIIVICLVQIIFDAHWIFTMQVIKRGLSGTGFCEFFGCFFNLLVYLSWNILTFLSIELLIKLKRPLNTNYKLRFKVYVISALLFTTIEMSLTSWLGEYGMSALQTCFMVDGSLGYWIAMTPLFINTPIILFCLFLLVRTKGYQKNQALHKVVLASISMVLTWGLPTFTAGLRTIFGVQIIVLNYISFISGCFAGILLAVTRLGSKQILSRLWKVNRKKDLTNSCSLKDFNEILIEETSISVFYSEFTENTIKSMLILLSMALVVYKECKENYCFGYKKKKFYTSKEKYEKLSKYLDMSLIKQEKNGIWEYEREIFSNIRETCNITTQDLINSICSMSNFQKLQNENTGGRSGAFIFSTFDERFIIKTVTRNEKYFFLDILPAYAKRVTKHNDSKIVRIFGLFKIVNTKQCFIIMENILRIKEYLAIFDLKGSTDNRYVKSEPGSKSVLKDVNLEELKMKVDIGQNKKAELLTTLNGDIKFFKKFNIIDYSLLVVFYEKCEKNDSRYYLEGSHGGAYSLGIIDFLQEYSFSKKCEVLLKRIKGLKDTSACSAGKYSLRFLKFLEDKLFD